MDGILNDTVGILLRDPRGELRKEIGQALAKGERLFVSRNVPPEALAKKMRKAIKTK